MNTKLLSKTVLALVVSMSAMTMPAHATGGVSVQATRIIYPQNAKQESLSVHNSSPDDSFLVQSWVEDATGHKSHDFVVTPPLYLSGPKNENTLRIMRVGGQQLSDREMIYYFVSKAIPSIDEKSGVGKNVLRIAAATRIKLFVRPAGLTPAPDKATSMLTFQRAGGQLKINNPTPYYLTLTDMKAGGKNLEDIMVAPKSSASERLPAGSGSELTFHNIDDFGAVSAAQRAVIK